MTKTLQAAEHVDRGLAIAPQLAADDLPALAAAGFRAVINNRRDRLGKSLP